MQLGQPREPQSLFGMREATQETKVGSESAPAFNQNLQWRSEMPAQSQGQSAWESDQVNFRYTVTQSGAQNKICTSYSETQKQPTDCNEE